jgi:hypothetical protein
MGLRVSAMKASRRHIVKKNGLDCLAVAGADRLKETVIEAVVIENCVGGSKGAVPCKLACVLDDFHIERCEAVLCGEHRDLPAGAGDSANRIAHGVRDAVIGHDLRGNDGNAESRPEGPPHEALQIRAHTHGGPIWRGAAGDA